MKCLLSCCVFTAMLPSLALRFGAHGGEKSCLLLPLDLLPVQQLCTESGNSKMVGKPLLLLREEAGNPF